MRRTSSILGSLVFLVLAPGTVAGYVPWLISRWRFAPIEGPLRVAALILGALLIAAGLPVLLDSFARFALQGLGTPAPVAPTQNLVVTGLYRRVRNPMYVAVTSLILGQALLFGNLRVFLYGLFVWLAFHLFVLFYEEPTLRRTFGPQYETFCSNVPRWIPRITPWKAVI